MTRRARCFVFMAVLSLAARVSAYESQTHRDMSAAAASRSVLAIDPVVLDRVRLRALSVTEPVAGTTHTPLDFVKDGAESEDSLLPPRPQNHFYDPVHDTPLNPCVTEVLKFLIPIP